MNFILPQVNIIVTHDFITQRDEKSYGTQKRRDCEILEWYLEKEFGMVFSRSPYQYSSDLQVKDHPIYIDVKHINGTWWNVKSKDKHIRAIDKDQLTHFLFYRTKQMIGNQADRPLEVGDVVTVDCVKMCPAKECVQELRRSQRDGWFLAAPV